MNTTPDQVNLTQDDFLNWKTVQISSSKYIQRLVEIIWFSGLLTTVCLIGIPTNVLNCIVFWRQGLKDRMNLCLFSLALMNTCCLACSLTIYCVSSFVRFYDLTLGDEFYMKSAAALIVVLSGFRLTSGCVGVVISVERCLCVLYPLHAQSLIRTRTVTILIVACFILSQSLFSIGRTMTQVVTVQIEGKIVWLTVPTEFYLENKVFLNTLIKTLLGTVIPIVMCVVISIATTVTVFTLRTAMSWRVKTSFINEDSQSRQMALTKMLVIVSTTYVITMVPFVGREIAVWLVNDCYVLKGSCYDIMAAATGIVYTFPEINNCFHFFIYFHHSSRFQAEFQKVFNSVGKFFNLSRENKSTV